MMVLEMERLGWEKEGQLQVGARGRGRGREAERERKGRVWEG